jgi:hypothetical protein
MRLDALKELLNVMDKYNLQFHVTYDLPNYEPELTLQWEDGDNYESVSFWEAELRYAKLSSLIKEEDRDE